MMITDWILTDCNLNLQFCAPFMSVSDVKMIDFRYSLFFILISKWFVKFK